MCQGDRLTSLIPARPPCQADRRKPFISKLKWDIASYHPYCIQKLIIFGPCGKDSTMKLGYSNSGWHGQLHLKLPSACFTESCVLPLQKTTWIPLRVSIDHGELLLRYAGAVNWHKIAQVWQKRDGSRTAKQSFEMTNGLNQHDVAMKQLMFRHYEWAVNQVSIKVWASKFYHCLWKWWNYGFRLSLEHESLYQQHKTAELS